MGAIYILWLRELKRYIRSRVQIVVSLAQTLPLSRGLRRGLLARLSTGRLGSYIQFVAPASSA